MQTDIRFLNRVSIDAGGCWDWLGSKTAGRTPGYGLFTCQGKRYRAYRIAYEIFGGYIPSKYVIDHLCRNTSCVNPEHLESVTNRENMMRGQSPAAQCFRSSHCSRGHEFTVENTFINPPRKGHGNGTFRVCRECKRLRDQKYRNRSRG